MRLPLTQNCPKYCMGKVSRIPTIGDYTIFFNSLFLSCTVVTIDNSAGRGTETTAGELISHTADGSPLPPPGPTDLIREDFSRSATTQFNAVGVQADDHNDDPTGRGCTVIADDNTNTRGRIDAAGDVDCFAVVPSTPTPELVFRATGFSGGMDAVLTIFDSAGVQIAMVDMSNAGNPERGVIAVIGAPDARGMSFAVRHADQAASSGAYDVSVGAKILTDDGAVEPPLGTSCTELFSDAPEFLLCGETTTTCSFNARTGGDTCDELCVSLGSTCVGAINNEGSSCQEIPGSTDTCQTRRETEICICERPEEPTPPPGTDCTQRFGDAPGFRFCAETATSCLFNADINGGTCDEMCRRFGSQCLDAFDNEGATCNIVPGSNDTCQTRRETEICECER